MYICSQSFGTNTLCLVACTIFGAQLQTIFPKACEKLAVWLHRRGIWAAPKELLVLVLVLARNKHVERSRVGVKLLRTVETKLVRKNILPRYCVGVSILHGFVDLGKRLAYACSNYLKVR
jgi:hypothetical protein